MYKNVIDGVVDKFQNNESISLDLIQYFNNEEFENQLIEIGDIIVKKSFSSTLEKIERMYVVVALSYIALKYYDGDLWTHIRRLFCNSYECGYPEPRVDGKIRSVISFFRNNANHSDANSYIAVPLITSEITHYWLYHFFEFCFDIYEKNLLLNREIKTEELEEELYNTFKSIYKNKEISEMDDLLDLGVKTYKLSKFTQSALKTDYHTMGLAKVGAQCVNYIVKLLNKEPVNVSPFYLDAFNKWVKNNFETKEAKARLMSGDRGVWKNSLEYKANRIFLKTKTVKIDSSYDPESIELQLLSEDKIINTIKNITIDFDAISGFIIQSGMYDVGNTVLNKLSYKIVGGNDRDVLYDSKDSLHREICFFDEKGQEIFPNRDYEGYMLCVTHHIIDIELYLHEIGEYIVSTIFVDPNKTYTLDNKDYVFKTFEDGGIYGNVKDWILVKKTNSSKYISVYNEMSCIIVETTFEHTNFKIVLDNKVIGEEVVRMVSLGSYSNGVKIYKFDFKEISPGYHNFYLATNDHKIISKTEYSFIFSEKLEKIEEKLSSDKYVVHFNSSLGDKNLEFTINDVFVNYIQNIPGLGVCDVLLYPEVPSFSFDRKQWFAHNERIDYSSIKNYYDKIYIKGVIGSFDVKSINSCSSKSLNVEIKKDTLFKQHYIDISYLMGIESNVNFETIRILKNNIFCDLKIDFVVFVNMYNSLLAFNSENNCTEIEFDFNEEKELIIEIKNEESGELCFQGSIKGKERKMLNVLEPFRKYSICLKQKISLFSSRVIEKIPYCFYDSKKITNQHFKIVKVEIYGDLDNQIELCNDLINPILKIYSVDRDNPNGYVGGLKKLDKFKKNMYWNLGILKISTDGEFNDGQLWVYISDKEGDMLLFDKKQRIVFYQNDDSNPLAKKMLPIARFLLKVA